MGDLILKRSIYIFCILAIVVVTLSFLFYRYFSVESILRTNDFSKNDIVLKKEYTAFPKESANVFLLSNPEKIGLIYSKKNKFGIWEKEGISSVADNSTDEQIVTVGFAITNSETDRIESHIMVAYYLESEKEFNVKSQKNYHLNVEFITINNRVLLFAHAISNTGISSDDVISYLESYYK